MRVFERPARPAGSAVFAEKTVEHAFMEKDEAGIDRRFSLSGACGPLLAKGKIEDDRELARTYRRLRRAGFSSGGVLTALKRLAGRPRLMEELRCR